MGTRASRGIVSLVAILGSVASAFALTGGLAIATSAGAASAAGSAAPPQATSWTTQTVNVPTFGNQVHFNSMSCPSATTCVAVGYYVDTKVAPGSFLSANYNFRALVATYTAPGTWTAFVPPTPTPKPYGTPTIIPNYSTILNSVSCLMRSASQVWCAAVGQMTTVETNPNVTTKYPTDGYTIEQPFGIGIKGPGNIGLASTWVSSTALSATKPPPHLFDSGQKQGGLVTLTAVSCWATWACIAVGNEHANGGGEQGITYTTTGPDAWGKPTAGVNPSGSSGGPGTNPERVTYAGISCSSGTSCVAVGSTLTLKAGSTPQHPLYNQRPLVEALTSTGWATSYNDMPVNAYDASLNSVSCPSATTCQAVGSYLSTFGEQGLSLSLSGGTWTANTALKSGGTGSVLTGVSCPSSTRCVSSGFYYSSAGASNTPGSSHTLVQTLTGVGWTPTTGIDPAGSTDPTTTAISCPDTNICVSIGGYQVPGQGYQAFASTEVAPEATHFYIAPVNPLLPVYPGVPIQVKVVAEGASGAWAYTYGGTVHFTSGDPLATMPADATLTDGTGAFSVTFGTIGSESLTITDTSDASITGTGTVVVSKKIFVPSEALNLYAYSGPGGIILTWKPPNNNGGAPVTGYVILRATASGAESSTALATSAGTVFMDRTASPGTTYYYVVDAVNAKGRSGRSNEVSMTIRGNLGGGRRVTASPHGHGYWLVGPDGGVFAYGDAKSYGSLSGTALSTPVVGLVATPSGKGYWLVQSDGEVHAFGDAKMMGSPAASTLSAPIVGMAADAEGRGYWLVGADGAVYAYGSVGYYGGLSSGESAYPVVSLSVTPDGGGYWIVDQNGTVHAFGDAGSYGSATPAGGRRLNQPIIDMITTADGKGYWLTGLDGGVYAFGDAHYFGSLGNQVIMWPIVGMVVDQHGQGYTLVDTIGVTTQFGNVNGAPPPKQSSALING
jgi:hypothetical protein